MWIIEIKSEPVGFLSLEQSAEDSVLDLGIYIGAEGRSGTGSLALKEALLNVRNEGFGRSVRADVFADNRVAIALYEKNGFRRADDFREDRMKLGKMRQVFRYEIDVSAHSSESG